MLRKTAEGYLFEEFIYCGCCCGFTRTKYDVNHIERKFIHGHYIKGKNNPQYGKFGELSSFYGKKHSEETRKIISEKGKWEKHSQWSGENPSYTALHYRVRKKFPKTDLCMLCKINPSIELACITSIYNEELRNWAWFCKKCHIEWDNRNVKISIARKKLK